MFIFVLLISLKVKYPSPRQAWEDALLFSWLNNIPHHFIYSSMDGHLGCFYILAVVNSIAINMGCR